MYEPRTYQHWVKRKDLISFHVAVKETDLLVSALHNLKSKTEGLVTKYRGKLETYIGEHPPFLRSLAPVAVGADAPDIVRAMAEAAAKVGVGPMAAVAGAIAGFVGRELSQFSPEIIIENGGDIYLRSLKPRLVGIYAGKSPLTGKVGLEINAGDTPLGISTSSGTVGHSLSLGRADAVTVLSPSAALADAAATAIGNMIKEPDDIPDGIEFARNIIGISGVLIIIDEKIGLWGKVRLMRTAVSETT
ncbi:MAG: UPF0280 family protein [Chloroflexota bacterium]